MKRYFMAFIGVILIGFNVTLLNLSGFGVDTFSCMNMAVSEHLPFSYGVWQIIVNIVIFIGLFIFVIKEKKGISAIFGFGTLWNMIGCGLLEYCCLFVLALYLFPMLVLYFFLNGT